MRVAIVADDRRLAEEHAVHARLCVGLVDAGLGVVRLVPETFDVQRSDPRERPLTLIPRIAFEPRVVPWLRGWRRGRMLDALERTTPDLVFTTGVDAWDVALDLGAELERPVLVEIASREEARRVTRHRRDAKEGTLCGCIVRSAPLGEAIRSALGPIAVHVPSGVATAAADRDEGTDGAGRGGPRNIVMLGSGGCARESVACLEGVRQVVTRCTGGPGVMICLELQGRQTQDVWRALRRLELLPYVSTVADVSELRDLVLGCDALIVPERRGVTRSVFLDAMACGMPIAALRDDDVDVFIPDVTARIVEEPDAQAWARTINLLLSSDSGTARLVDSARDHALRHHRSSDSIDALEKVLRSVVQDDVLPFGAASSR